MHRKLYFILLHHCIYQKKKNSRLNVKWLSNGYLRYGDRWTATAVQVTSDFSGLSTKGAHGTPFFPPKPLNWFSPKFAQVNTSLRHGCLLPCQILSWSDKRFRLCTCVTLCTSSWFGCFFFISGGTSNHLQPTHTLMQNFFLPILCVVLQ